MKKIVIILFAVILPVITLAQGSDPKFGINFSGFIKNDFFWDSRQNVSIREGHFLLYPSKVDRDAFGNDMNAKSSFNFLSIQSRLTVKITGPDVCKAKLSAAIEADFFGNENAYFVDANGFRLRHAYIKLNWPKTEVLMGQYWHPMFNPSCFPGVVSFNTGAPFQAFSRNPQVRLTQKLGNFNIMFAACSQRDFVSPGGSSVSLRNTSIPDLGLQFSYGVKNDSTGKEFLIGLGGGYKFVAPRIYSEITTTTVTSPSYIVSDTGGATHVVPAVTKATVTKYSVNERLGGYYAVFFMKYKCKPITYKLYAAYGQNIFDLTMLGGYAVSGINDAAIGQSDYTPFNTLSAWTEIMTNGKRIQFGLFGGFTQNMGTTSNVLDYSTTNRGADIKYIYRAAPRIVFISGKFQFMTELEYTSAYYALKDPAGKYYRDDKGLISSYSDVANIRAIFAVQYNF
jgi:cell division protein FtsI/penicillin-binding protein 2